MSTPNLHSLAKGNAHNLQRQFEAMEKSLPDQNARDRLSELIEMLSEKWSISINIKASDMIGFLDSGKHKNIYEVFNGDAALIKDKLKKYPRRLDFDAAFENGENFRYAALNIGNLGLQHFGDFCIIIEKPVAARYEQLVFLKYDSLSSDPLNGLPRYFNQNDVAMDKVEQDISDRYHQPHLTALKCFPKLDSASSGTWKDVVCNNKENDYIEAITVSDIPVEDVAVVRINREVHKMLMDSIIKGYSKSSPMPDDIKRTQEIIQALNDKPIPVEYL
jgi:hypothetical protein